MVIWSTEFATCPRVAAEKFTREFWDAPREISEWNACWDGTYNFRVANGLALYKIEVAERGYAIRRLETTG